MKTKPGNIKYSKIATVPTVKFIKSRSGVGEAYAEQVKNLHKLSKFGGLIILDAHQNALDIFASGASVIKGANFNNVILPVTAYDYYFPLSGMFFDKIQKDGLLDIFPVFRKEELEKNKFNSMKRHFFPNNQNPKKLNKKFLSRSKSALNGSGNVVLVSPYGGIKPLGSRVKHGVSELLKTGAPTVCTWSKFNWKKMRFNTAVSSPIYFNENSDDDYIQKVITSKFKEISLNN